MTIVSSEILEDRQQAHDQRYVWEKHTDHLAKDHFVFYAAELGADVNANMLARVPQINHSLIEGEIGELTGRVESGEIAALDVEPVHPETDTLADRRRTFFRRLLRYVVNNRDIKIARIVFYPVWYYLKFESTYTAQQIASYLDITIPQLQKLDARFQAIHDNLAFIDADDSYLGEVE